MALLGMCGMTDAATELSDLLTDVEQEIARRLSVFPPKGTHILIGNNAANKWMCGRHGEVGLPFLDDIDGPIMCVKFNDDICFLKPGEYEWIKP